MENKDRIKALNILIEELPSGSYRVRKTINKQTISIVFDHNPSQLEIMQAITDKSKKIPTKGSFESCAKSYIASKNNVISPSTIRGYTAILDKLPDDFKRMDVSKVTQIDVQNLINDHAKDHKPKTTRNVHGFISAVLSQYRPDMILHTTLPQKMPSEGYIPTEKDIERILEASKDDTFYHIPFQLGIMGLRRSEICALELSDIEGNTLSITKALVEDDDNNWVIKQTKTTAGTRQLYIPDSLVKEIQDHGKVYDGYPNSIIKGLHRYQDSLGIPRFRFHDLRHFFASYAHSQGISDADIMASGGWKSDYTMKSVYRHEMKQKEAQKTIFDKLIK